MDHKYLFIYKEKQFIKTYLNFNEKQLNKLCINKKALGFLNHKDIYKFTNNNWEFLCTNKSPDLIYILSENVDKISITGWCNLCLNYNDSIVLFLIKHIDKLTFNCWLNLCLNENDIAIKLISKKLKTDFNVIYLKMLCKNKNAIEVIKQYKSSLNDSCIKNLCSNENAFELLKEFINFNSFSTINNDYIRILCLNKNENIVKFLYDNFSEISSYLFINICLNTSAVSIIKKYYENDYNTANNLLCLNYLCYNNNPDVISILSKNLHNLSSLNDLCINKNAIDIIDSNLNKISIQGFINLSKNSNGCKIIKKIVKKNLLNKESKECKNKFITSLLSNSSIFYKKQIN